MVEKRTEVTYTHIRTKEFGEVHVRRNAKDATGNRTNIMEDITLPGHLFFFFFKNLEDEKSLI